LSPLNKKQLEFPCREISAFSVPQLQLASRIFNHLLKMQRRKNPESLRLFPRDAKEDAEGQGDNQTPDRPFPSTTHVTGDEDTGDITHGCPQPGWVWRVLRTPAVGPRWCHGESPACSALLLPSLQDLEKEYAFSRGKRTLLVA